MDANEFKNAHNDRITLQRFQNLLNNYTDKLYKLPGASPMNLVKIEDKLTNDGVNEKARSKVLAAMIDLSINLVMLFSDLMDASGVWNKYIAENISKSDLLASDMIFAGRFRYAHNMSNFVVRYRAIWDKLFNLQFLLFQPCDYRRFNNNNKGSRRKFFLKNYKRLDEEAVEKIRVYFECYEQEFRTPELHREGKMRTWIFDSLSLDCTPGIKLLDHWNQLLNIVRALNAEILGTDWSNFNQQYESHIKK